MDTSTMISRVKDRSLPISELVESMGKRLLSPDSLEEAMGELATVISALPKDFLAPEEVKLLLRFARGVDSSNDEFLCLNLTSCLVNCSNFTATDDAAVVFHLTEDVDVQARTQKERNAIYAICEQLLDKASPELRANPRRVGEGLIRSVSGEADPRCLLLVFSLIKIYCRSFNVKNEVDIAFQLFDVLSVYYPLQYKPKSDGDVTYDQLAAACRSTLTCCPQFSKVFYMFVADKLQDPDDSYEDKMQICELMLEGVPAFDKADFLDSLESIFDGLRTAAVDPRYKGDMSSLTSHLSHLISLLKKEDQLYLKAAVDSALQNMEPFVVQPAMGLMDKALTYLRPFAEEATAHEKTVLSRVFGWLIEKIQSPVEPTCEGALEVLHSWAYVGPLDTRASILGIYSDALLSALDVAEKTCPTLASSVRDVFLPAFAEAGLFGNVKGIALELMEKADFEAEKDSKRTSVSSLISTLAAKNPSQVEELILEFEERVAAKGGGFVSNLNGVYCAAVLDEETWEKYRGRVIGALAIGKLVHCLDSDVQMAERVAKAGPTTIAMQLLEAVKPIEVEDPSLLEVAQLVKRLFCCLPSTAASEEKKDTVAEHPHFFLVVAMTGNPSEIDVSYSKATNPITKRTLAFARACWSSENENSTGNESWSRTEELKGMIVQGITVAEERIQRFFEDVTAGEVEATRLFDFEPPFGCPEALGVKKSPLWRQRILHFLLPKFAQIASADGNHHLISLLPAIFAFLKQCDASLAEFYGNELKPVTSKALERLGSYDSRLVQELLPVLVEDLGPVSDEAAHQFGMMLVDMVRETKEATVTLSALTALEILAKKASRGAIRSLLPVVVKGTTASLLAASRLVRRKAASVRELWTKQNGSI